MNNDSDDKRLNELITIHEVDQAVAESIALGNMRAMGTNEKGDPLLQLTAKGVCRVTCMIAAAHIRQADAEKRDFSPEEKQKILPHLVKAIQALQEGKAEQQPG